MQSFTFHTPTEIVFGKDSETQVSTLIKKHGGSKVFIVYGGGSIVHSGLLERITTQLEGEDIPYRAFGGAQPNPLLTHAYKGISEAIDFGADFILAVGGGSAIDTAKAIAHGAASPESDIWKFWLREATIEKSLPVGVVLTISAAGSETSASAVITNAEIGKKRGLSTDFNRPRFAVMNPVLTFTLPKYQIACGIIDIIMHTLDRFFSQGTDNETTDEIATAILCVTIKNGLMAIKNPQDYNAMSEIMWCGSLSHNGITGLGSPMDFSVHQLGHEIGGRFDVAHGASLSTMWGAWANYVMPVNPARFEQFAQLVWDVKNAEKGIEKMVGYFKEIGMPTCFTELGIGIQENAVLEELADSCVFHGKRLVGNFKPLGKEDCYNIYKMANK